MIHSPTCQHALRALIYLAEKNSPGPVLVREIADKSRVPRQSLAKILHALRNKGLVRSTKGPGGGYRLARAGENMRVVEVIEAVKPWENVRFRGEDVKRGAPVARKGDEVTIGLTALFGALGISQVSVARRPVVALLSTGSELIEAGRPLAPGKIYESNRIPLAALLLRAGALPRIFPLVADTQSATCAALEQAFAECDVVVTTGGVSVGEFDYVKAAFKSLGGELDFWRVAIRPGKPFLFGKWLDKILFGLPGNPLSAFVTCLLLVRPALLKLQGANAPFLPSHVAVLGEPLVNRSDRRHFVRIVVDDDGMVRSAGLQASHALSSFARAHGLVEVPPNTTLPAGASVSVLRWEF